MSKLGELLQEFVNKDYEELVAIGKIAFGEIYPVCKAIDKENDGFVAMTSIILSAIGADGKLSVLESKWLKDVIGLDDDAIDTMIKLYNSKSEDLTNALYDNAPDELKSHLMMFVLSILSVDEKISREETAFIAKLFA